ncbi:MAG: imelysin family protein [Burkholderiales bacterium]
MKHILRALVLGLALSATPQLVTAAEPAGTVAADVSGVLTQYAEIVHASYDDTLQSAKAMQKAIDAFLAQPSTESQQVAQKAWRNAREFYGQTEAFRFYGGPIDGENGPEGRMNAWPMDESYVDYVQGRADSGLINDPRFVINRQNIITQNERGGEENIASGWHAIEFLLWGQDLSETGPGNRSYTDFVDGKMLNADRRRQYLKVVSDLLVDDLTSLTREWKAGRNSNFRAQFEKGGVESVRKIFVGLGSLSRGELAGERMEVALASQDQEDEHSCFSDNTHRDIVNNALGIENVWLARYKRADGNVIQGPSLRDLVAKQDTALAERTTQQIAKSVALAKAIQPPFDHEIIGGRDAPGRKRVQATVDSLIQQSKDLVDAAAVLGITKLTLVQP